MSIESLVFRDWRKQAAAVADDASVEKAFFDQAYPFIINKAPVIAQAPYAMGFEIVHKNDDNTRMVGIFAFRIGPDLNYVPVFFMNGEISGTDLLYRHGTKTFVPLTKEWVTFLLETSSYDLGGGVDRRDTNQATPNLDMQSIAYPPRYRKSASAYTLKAWEGMQTTATLGPLLKQFILEDGGTSSVELITKAAARDFTFADNLFRLIPEDHWMPPELHQAKKASAPAKTLTLRVGRYEAGKIKSAAEDYMRDGFELLDDRSDVSVVSKPEQQSFHNVSSAGLYQVQTDTGSNIRAFCAPAAPYCEIGEADGGASCCSPTPAWDSGASKPDIVVVDLDSKESERFGNDVIAEATEEVNPPKEDSAFTEPASGKAYRILMGGTCLTKPFVVKEVTEENGLKVLQVADHVVDYTRRLKINPDIEKGDLSAGVAGSADKFIEVKVEKSPSGDYYRFPCSFRPIRSHELSKMLLDIGIKEAAVRRIPEENRLQIRALGETSGYLSKMAAAVTLARNLHLPAAQAIDLANAALKDGEVRFFYELPAKKAAITLQNIPEFVTTMDDDFGIPVEEPQQFEVGSDDNTFDEPPPQRLGDAWDPTMGANGAGGGMDTSMPNDLAQTLQMAGSGSVFDHGVVGSLVKTYDSVALIDKYIPKLEVALDCLGRMLFLLYWKPTDFKQVYGGDDLVNKENELLSNFKSFGALVLSLLKQSKEQQTGTPAFYN